MQQDLFSQPQFEIHRYEKPRESLQYLDRKHFSNNCKTIFNALMNGEKLTCTEILLKYGIGDGRRRLGDLRENGVQMSFECNARNKRWYFSEIDKINNKKFKNG